MAASFPDYGNSICSLMGSIGRRFGVDTGYAGLKRADEALSRGSRSVVLIVFDGMGAAALERNLPADSFLRRGQADTISTVFPSTTVAAMTSFYSGLSPLEHGWLGWSLYFKEYGRTLDTFLDRDSFTKKPIGVNGAAKSLMPYEELRERIEAGSKGSLPVYTVNPPNVEKHPDDRRLAAASLDEFFGAIRRVCQAPGQKLVLAYWPEPDGTMHAFGPYAAQSKAMFAGINAGMSSLAGSVKDALFLITADHGQIDIDAAVELSEIPDLAECLAMPPFIEARAMSFFLVPGSEKRFAKAFKARLGRDFFLLSREEVFRRGLLGRGRVHPKTSDFIGDYLAIGRGRTMLTYKTRLPDDLGRTVFKGHHAGLSPEEMLVPLIIV
jgi:hypothetical protein